MCTCSILNLEVPLHAYMCILSHLEQIQSAVAVEREVLVDVFHNRDDREIRRRNFVFQQILEHVQQMRSVLELRVDAVLKEVDVLHV